MHKIPKWTGERTSGERGIPIVRDSIQFLDWYTDMHEKLKTVNADGIGRVVLMSYVSIPTFASFSGYFVQDDPEAIHGQPKALYAVEIHLM